MCTRIAVSLVLHESESDSADMQLIETVLCCDGCCMFLCSFLGIRHACTVFTYLPNAHTLFAPKLNNDRASIETCTSPDGC